MNQTIFDAIEPSYSDDQKGYIKLAENIPQSPVKMPKDKSWLNTAKEYGKTFVKGSVEGISRLGRIMGPLPDPRGRAEKELENEQSEVLDELLPTEDQFGQRALRRGLQQLPSAAAFPGTTAGGTAIRALSAGVAGETAEELGAPEWLQTAAELTAYIGPDITKKLLEKGSNKQLIAFAKKMGMTDEQITPLIQSDFKQKWLSKMSPKRGRTQEALSNTKKGLSEAYTSIQNGEKAAIEIGEKENGNLINAIYEKLNELPRNVRGLIEKDLDDLLSNKITGKSLINFWKDINSNYEVSSQLSSLKDPIKKALNTISPEVASDFDMINKLYTKYYPISSKLKPNITSDIITAAEAIGLGSSGIAAMFGHYMPLIGILGDKAARKISQQMLINPRFQQLAQKMVVALNQNKYALGQKLYKDFISEIGKFSPESAKKLNDFSIEEMEQLINNQSLNEQL